MADYNKDIPQVLQNLQGPEAPTPPPSPPRKTWRWRAAYGWALGIILAGLALGYPVEAVVTAPGRVIPSDRVKPIQHLEGGIVSKVYVKEGQRVKTDQPLVEIDLGGNSLNLEELTAREAAFQAAKIRLTAESTGKALTVDSFPKELGDAAIDAEMTAFRARTLEQEGTRSAAVASMEQARSRRVEQEARASGFRERMNLLSKEIEVSETLFKERLIPETDLLEKRRQFEATKGDLAAARAAVTSAGASINEAQAKIAEIDGRFRRRASEELATLERQLASATEDLSRAKTQRGRTLVKAPIDGIVKGMRSQSSGWVVKGGEQIMEVVPDEDKISVEARLSPTDRGFVSTDQKARVKISAYDFLRYGSIDGKISLVSADVDRDTNNPSAPPYYRLVIDTDKAYVGSPDRRVTPGMEAEIDLIVGKDPFIWFMLRPVIKLQREAFREP